jgi:hypothetical protein
MCRHANIMDCPLYHAMHEAGLGPTCWGKRMAEGICRVDDGADYDHLVEALRARAPRLVAECEFGADYRASKAQRERNMRAAGIH